MALFHDRALIDGPARITREGHFVARARVARANNVQDYFPAELGLPPKADGTPYRIFRPEASIFAKDSLKTAFHKPIVMDHPAEDVTDANRDALEKGEVGAEILRDGEFMVVPITVTRKDAVKAIQTTHPEFSWGYAADLDMTPGKFGDQEYDGSMTPPEYNHLAMCGRARGGSDLRVTDSLVIIDERPAHLRDTQENPMKIKIGDAEVDATNGEAVKIAVDVLNGKLSDAATNVATLTTKLGDAEGKVATLTAEKVALEAKVADAVMTPEKLRDAAKSYAQVVEKAKALGVTVSDSMDEPAIMKAVVDAKLGDAAAGWTAEQIASGFVVLAKDAKVERTTDILRDAITGQPVSFGDARAKRDEALAARNQSLRDAHKQKEA